MRARALLCKFSLRGMKNFGDRRRAPQSAAFSRTNTLGFSPRLPEVNCGQKVVIEVRLTRTNVRKETAPGARRRKPPHFHATTRKLGIRNYVKVNRLCLRLAWNGPC